MGKIMGKLKNVKRRRIIGAAVLTLVVVGGGVFFVRKGKGEKPIEISTSVQTATVEKGNLGTTIVGTGNLESADSTNIQVVKGLTIDELFVESGDEVTAGTVIATVTRASVADKLIAVKADAKLVKADIDKLSSDANNTGTTEYLKKLVLESERTALKECETELTNLLEDLSITAASDGVVGSLTVAAGDVIGSNTTSDNNSSSGNNEGGASNVSTKVTSGGFMSLATDADPEESIAEESTVKEITTCDDLIVTAPATGATPQKIIQGKDYRGTITWNTSDDVFKAGTEYIATIVLTADEACTFAENILVQLANAYLVEWQVFDAQTAGNHLRIVATYEKTAVAEAEIVADKDNEEDNLEDQLVDNSNQNEEVINGSAINGAVTGGENSGSGDVANGDVDNTTTDQEDNDSATAVDTDNLRSSMGTISATDTVLVSINVDELDILTVAKGQQATVTLDAVSGTEFEGQVEQVATEGTTNNSSSKYVVKIRLERTKEMLLGMSASATININEVEEALLIPVNALQESGGKVFVYTSADAQEQLSGEVEVETGISDGSQVEVLSGLAVGDTVYYLKSESTGDTGEFIFEGEMQDGMAMPGGGMSIEMAPSGTMPTDGGQMRGGRD